MLATILGARHSVAAPVAHPMQSLATEPPLLRCDPMLRIFAIVLLLAPALVARDFDPRRDAFAFSNETVLSYEVDRAGILHIKTRATPAHLTHRCFCFTRSAMQFWKFAR